MSTLPAVGSHVRVRWGFDIVKGEVVDVYDSGFGKQVVFSVILEGSNEPVTATFCTGAVELAA